MNAKKNAILNLNVAQHNKDWALSLLDAGKYKTKMLADRNGIRNADYDEYHSEICWGWQESAFNDGGSVMVTLAHGERGNDAFDPEFEGLTFWI